MYRIVIFASGSGTNAENIIRYFKDSNFARVSWVLCNRAEAGVLDRAEALGVPTRVFSKKQLFSSDFIDFVRKEADLVVLATGMVPNLKDGVLPLGLERDEDGFGLDSNEAKVAGVARRPADVATCVRDATGAAARALAAGRA